MRSKRPGDHSSAGETARTTSTEARPPRRNFLLALGAGGAGTAIVALSAGSVTPPQAAQQPSPDGKGYELTDHVRRYYRTAKI